MRQVKVKEYEAINLGFQYENMVTEVLFDVSQIYDAVGTEGTWEINYLAPNGRTRMINSEHYSVEDNILHLVVYRDEFTIIPGDGSLQLTYMVSEAAKKTIIYNTNVADSLDPPFNHKVIYRGTTPEFNFYVDFDTELIGELGDIRIIFSQDFNIVTKYREDISIVHEDRLLNIVLTHEDTLKLQEGIARIEIWVKFENGIEAVSSYPMCIEVKPTIVGELDEQLI